MFLRWLLTLAIFLLISNTPHIVSAEMVDRVLAVVNNDVITLSELNEEMAGITEQITRTTPQENLSAKLNNAREKILDSLIDKKLIVQKAQEKGITVSEQDVDNAFEEVLHRTGMTSEEMIRTLEKDGITEAIYRNTLKIQLLQNALISKELRQKIVITDEAIQNYYTQNYTAEVPSGEYYLLQIGINWLNTNNRDETPDETIRKKTKKHAEQIHDLALAGQDFRQLAKKFSNLPSATDGGDIGSFNLDDMAENMKDAITGLDVGQISKIIETPSGYQFFKLLSTGQEDYVSTASYETAKNEIRQLLYEKEMKKIFRSWIKELKDNAYIQKR